MNPAALPSTDAAIPGVRPLREWLRRLDDPGSDLRRRMETIYGSRERSLEPVHRCRNTLTGFAQAFGADRSVLLVRSTGRINLLGMHIDHRGGSVNPIAIREAFLVAEPRDDDQVVLRDSEDMRFPEERFTISECLPRGRKIMDWDAWCHDEFEKRRHDSSATWSTYFRAGVLFFQHHFTAADGRFAPAFRGMNVLLNGHVPQAAGLSSSSCLVVGAAEAILRINAQTIEPMEFAQLCGTAEWYVGTRGGFGDHAAITFGEPGAMVHITAFPTTVRRVAFPDDYRIVMADSLVEARKRADARDAFNSRVAAYMLGQIIARRRQPALTARMQHLRDLQPEKLLCSEADIYRILKTMPEQADRKRLATMLPDDHSEMERIYRSHAEPAEGYHIRRICLYGIAECIRSDRAVALLENGDIHGFGELINLHHEGDRVTRRQDGHQIPFEKNFSDAWIDACIADCESDDAGRIERARLWRQPGGYNVSIPEVDWLVDLALETPGVVGAGLVGAGLGGSMIAMVAANRADALVRHLEEGYYRPRNLPAQASIVFPVKGAGILD